MVDEKIKALKQKMFDFRVTHNLSMKKFADLANITEQTVFNIENELTTPTRFTIAKIETAIATYEKNEK